MLKTMLMIFLVGAGTTGFAMDEKAKADIEATKQACASEIQTAGCADKEYGQGLMKCLKAYKKSHADFQISQSCKDAKKAMRSHRKERKAARGA